MLRIDDKGWPRACVFTLMLTVPSLAQTLEFDVASIRPTTPGSTSSSHRHSNGRWINTGTTAVELIGLAYGVESRYVTGAPKWAELATYSIEAKAPPENPNAQQAFADFKARVRSLLEQRFKLQCHRETRERDGYVLAVAKQGAKLTKSADPTTSNSRESRGSLSIQSCRMTQLARVLSQIIKHPIVNETGLPGAYDVSLEFEPDDGMQDAYGSGNGRSAGVSLFTALERQLGLKLEKKRITIPIVVVDRIEHPSAN